MLCDNYTVAHDRHDVSFAKMGHMSNVVTAQVACFALEQSIYAVDAVASILRTDCMP